VFYVKGLARTGKSTIITQGFKKFYDQIDVKTMAVNDSPFARRTRRAMSFSRNSPARDIVVR